MSSGKIARPVPPEKGVFPLDHFGDCKSSKATYLTCLRQNNNDYDACVALSQAYLECRMKKNSWRSRTYKVSASQIITIPQRGARLARRKSKTERNIVRDSSRDCTPSTESSQSRVREETYVRCTVTKVYDTH